eukprot:TRINITY_DN12353_c0_g1_i1.p1 TRINITY_DN12353_c0_g1~~TRINITY_DN12353_c0_g1_i1.p1  ORF type:complete len:169 (-),score=30.93 TRINITY_DN12353_c0_g1_i1:268-774(-)
MMKCVLLLALLQITSAAGDGTWSMTATSDSMPVDDSDLLAAENPGTVPDRFPTSVAHALPSNSTSSLDLAAADIASHQARGEESEGWIHKMLGLDEKTPATLQGRDPGVPVLAIGLLAAGGVLAGVLGAYALGVFGSQDSATKRSVTAPEPETAVTDDEDLGLSSESP